MVIPIDNVMKHANWVFGKVNEECSAEYTISGPLVVPDSNLTASSSSSSSHGPSAVRLRPLTPGQGVALSCWRPLSSHQGTREWIQADFERVEVLRGVSTRGNPAAAEWVKTFLLLYHPDGLPPADQSWTPYEEPYGTVKLFTGNVDNNSTVTTYLKGYIPTRSVRLQPQTWQGSIALQVDLLVCEAGCQEQPLLARVSDEQLSATSSSSRHGPQASRLTTGSSSSIASSESHGSTGGWVAEFSRPDQYIQVSLSVPQEVRAVSTQGVQMAHSWLTAFHLSWSLDNNNWTNYTQGGHLKQRSSIYVQTFSANYDPVSVRKHYLTPFLAHYVRLHPTQWTGAIALSWELYGCPGKNGFRPIGCFADHSNERDLPYEPYTDLLDGMDPILCTRHCFNKGYSYAGLQARDKCYCGNGVGRYGVSPDCNIQCFPQKQFNCGGMTANFVYTTGLSWKRLREQCYRYFTNASDWDTARALCAAQHATLVSVPDRSVNLLLYSFVGASATVQGLAWIGLNDLREDRYFQWSNEEEVVYTDWDLHQPPPEVTGESRHCVAVSKQTGGWMAEDCSRRLPYLCRTDPRPADSPPNATAAPPGCRQGMVAYKSFCYVVVEENRTRSAARDLCTAFGAKPLVVNSRFEQAFVTSLLSGRNGLYWTDVSDLHNPGVFTSGNGQYDVMYTNWDAGMPDSHRYGHCVAIAAGTRAGLWRNVPCGGQTAKAICRVLRDNYPEPAIPVMRHASNCSINWVESNSSLCYQINNVDANLQRSWTEARADCREQRGDLASFLTTPLMEAFWRAKLLGSSNHFWIGLRALASGALAWSDGSPVTLDIPWSPGQPDSGNGTRACVELHAPSGTLALRDCRLPRNWLCAIRSGVQPFQRLSERILPTAGPAGSCLPLDDTWKRYGDSCYRVTSGQPATWRQARATCQQDRADLASVTNIQENMFILSLAQKTPELKMWIGLSELTSRGGYYGWSDGSSVRFVNWGGVGPDDADGQESCGEMLVRTGGATTTAPYDGLIVTRTGYTVQSVLTGRWSDNHCALSQAYVCKRNVSPFTPTTPTAFPPNEGGCGDGGWVVFGTRCYLVQGGPGMSKTWQEAFQDCRSKATPFARVALASVRGPRENAFLTTQLYTRGMAAWVGLHRVNQTYLWADEQELTYTHWDIGEPNGGQQVAPYWNVPTTPASHCPSGFQRLGPSCYLYWNSSLLSWQDARDFCTSRGGSRLVSILSQVEQDFVYLSVTGGEPVYSGGSVAASKEGEGYPSAWIGMSGSLVKSATLWQWSDSWPVAFTNWGPGGDLNVTDSRHCVTMNSNGTWSNQDCSVKRPFVCKITSEKPPYTRDPSSGVCEGREWTAFASHCYAFYVTERVTFAHASFACSQRGASLASVHSPSANQFLQNVVKAKSALPIWIGFRQRDKGAYSWRDQSRVDYLNWDTGYPKGSNGDGTTLNCGQLSPWNGRWINDDCNTIVRDVNSDNGRERVRARNQTSCPTWVKALETETSSIAIVQCHEKTETSSFAIVQCHSYPRGNSHASSGSRTKP
ncbi:hypothetical protein ACOMHN_055620 [Nucella lapillus]